MRKSSELGSVNRRRHRKAGTSETKKTHKNDKMKSFWKTFAVAFVICVLLGTGAIWGVHAIGNINPFDTNEEENVVLAEQEEMLSVLVTGDSPFFEAFTQSDRVNVLLLGINGGMTDTIMLVSFDKKAKHVDIISVPRDTYYEREGANTPAAKKINAAYKGNPVNTAKAVSEILMGIPINYYAVIEYDGVKNIVDSMGGVPMNITVKGGMHYKDPYDTPPLVIDIPEGEQVLDGEHAVQFLRYRHGYAMGDLGRVEAQQQFMKNAFKQCLGFDLPKIAKTVFENVDSDVTIGVATGLATKAIGMQSDAITTYMLPVDIQQEAPYYVFPRTEDISNMLTEIYMIGAEEETPEDGADAGDGTGSETDGNAGSAE